MRVIHIAIAPAGEPVGVYYQRLVRGDTVVVIVLMVAR